jgi:hypothetical protein
MANIVDTIIDYPNSKIYVEQLCQQMKALEVLTEQQVINYRLHIVKVANDIEQQ